MGKLYSSNILLRGFLLVAFITIVLILLSDKFMQGIFRLSFSSDTYGLDYLNEKSAAGQCKWKYEHYLPSAWESFWYDNITLLQSQVYPTLTQPDQSNHSITALKYIIHLHKTLFHPTSSRLNKSDELLSKIFYRRHCPQSPKSDLLVSQSIEPLIGLLRDPLSVCSHSGVPSELEISFDHLMQSKRFFLLGPSAPFHNYQPSIPAIAPWLYQPGAQKILFDIGASYFNGVIKSTDATSVLGTRWFYEYFHTKSLSFDRIIAFEATPYNVSEYWDQIPDDVMGLLTFINTGVNEKGKYNPWNILKTVAKPEDYVVIKLDIDTPPLEVNLCEQILNDTTISSLIDEMFFEMHVSVSEMRVYWGEQPGELKDTYILFRKLRKLGIRMHSWP